MTASSTVPLESPLLTDLGGAHPWNQHIYDDVLCDLNDSLFELSSLSLVTRFFIDSGCEKMACSSIL